MTDYELHSIQIKSKLTNISAYLFFYFINGLIDNEIAMNKILNI